jgi:fructokinase
MQSVLQYADIVKVSEKELQIITDCGNLLPAVAKLLNIGIKIVCVTQGSKGCIIATKSSIDLYPAYKVETVDTLGSGDSFFGAFLYKLLEKSKDITELTSDELHDMAYFANACGAITSTKRGAIPAMPTLEEVNEFMAKYEPTEQ